MFIDEYKITQIRQQFPRRVADTTSSGFSSGVPESSRGSGKAAVQWKGARGGSVNEAVRREGFVTA